MMKVCLYWWPGSIPGFFLWIETANAKAPDIDSLGHPHWMQYDCYWWYWRWFQGKLNCPWLFTGSGKPLSDMLQLVNKQMMIHCPLCLCGKKLFIKPLRYRGTERKIRVLFSHLDIGRWAVHRHILTKKCKILNKLICCRLGFLINNFLELNYILLRVRNTNFH